ncbi:hypothetical protein OH76DRAFT_557086 [Lentinus brumalis]|uniref:Uncharacterized protein n=1 Tax=Lentinus brumalis TaxID=2498619 RepID=A0A371D9B2_9APHY|nr:hypothetical protein OH76DRAFT_557086 [Polyporus brumalis]
MHHGDRVRLGQLSYRRSLLSHSGISLLDVSMPVRHIYFCHRSRNTTRPPRVSSSGVLSPAVQLEYLRSTCYQSGSTVPDLTSPLRQPCSSAGSPACLGLAFSNDCPMGPQGSRISPKLICNASISPTPPMPPRPPCLNQVIPLPSITTALLPNRITVNELPWALLPLCHHTSTCLRFARMSDRPAGLSTVAASSRSA